LEVDPRSVNTPLDKKDGEQKGKEKRAKKAGDSIRLKL